MSRVVAAATVTLFVAGALGLVSMLTGADLAVLLAGAAFFHTVFWVMR